MSVCKKCEGIVAMHAFSTSNCESCGVEISSPHIPSYTLCDNCAGDNNFFVNIQLIFNIT